MNMLFSFAVIRRILTANGGANPAIQKARCVDVRLLSVDIVI
jgi:hypothetical protein